MTITLDATALAAINSTVRGAVWLVEMSFGTGIIRFTNAPIDIAVGSDTYSGFNNLVAVSVITESESNSAEKVTISCSVVNQAMLAATLGNVENYRGKRVRIYLQLTNDRFIPAGVPVLRWSGYMDKVQVSRTESPPEGGKSMGKIDMLCSRAGMARARNYQGRRHTDTQQQQRYPGDKGLEYMQLLLEQPTKWLSKKFQEI